MENPYEKSSQTSSNHNWAVELDGVLDRTFCSRAAAREHARWLQHHPAVRDRRRFGNGGRVVVQDRRPR
ncbi:MAG: hypothetical protein PVJ64_00365 [Gemmatimonadales bacterium]|jgi:hypothetical protein